MTQTSYPYSLAIRIDGAEYAVHASNVTELVAAGKTLLDRLPATEPAAQVPGSTKTCSHCAQAFTTDLFYRSDRYEDGFDYYCKDCRKRTAAKSHKNPNKKRRCTESNCRKPHYAKDLCRNHYAKASRNGTLRTED